MVDVVKIFTSLALHHFFCLLNWLARCCSSVVDDDDQGLEGDDDLHLVFPFACLRAALKPTCLVIRVQGGAKMHSDFSCIPSSATTLHIFHAYFILTSVLEILKIF